FESTAGSVWSAGVSADGAWLAIPKANGDIDLIDARTGKLARTLKGRGSAIQQIGFSNDAKTLFVACDDRLIHLYDRESGNWKASLDGKFVAAPHLLAISKDGRRLASSSASWFAGKDPEIRLWDLETKQERRLAHRFPIVHDLSMSPDGRL